MLLCVVYLFCVLWNNSLASHHLLLQDKFQWQNGYFSLPFLTLGLYAFSMERKLLSRPTYEQSTYGTNDAGLGGCLRTTSRGSGVDVPLVDVGRNSGPSRHRRCTGTARPRLYRVHWRQRAISAPPPNCSTSLSLPTVSLSLTTHGQLVSCCDSPH